MADGGEEKAARWEKEAGRSSLPPPGWQLRQRRGRAHLDLAGVEQVLAGVGHEVAGANQGDGHHGHLWQAEGRGQAVGLDSSKEHREQVWQCLPAGPRRPPSPGGRRHAAGGVATGAGAPGRGCMSDHARALRVAGLDSIPVCQPWPWPTLALAATEKAPFLKACMRPSLVRVPSGKKSTEAPCFSSSPHCFRHSSWLRRSTRLIITWPAAAGE